MSAVSSVNSGENASLLQLLQQNNAPGSFSGAAFQSQRKAEFGQALEAAGADPTKVGQIQSQIDAAIQSARKSGTTDRASVKNAVDTVLKNNGVDVTKFDQSLKAAHSARSGARVARGGRGGGDGDGDADDGGTGVSVNKTDASSQGPLSSLLNALSTGTTPEGQLYGQAGSLVDVAA